MENLLKKKCFMTRKIFIIVILITFIFADSVFVADIDLGEDYHVPEIFSSVLITSSDGTAIQNAVDHIQDGGTIDNFRRYLEIKHYSGRRLCKTC